MNNKKVEFAKYILRKGAEASEAKGEPLEIAYSGGKDSDVLLHLAKSANIPFRAIYKNTTIDPPRTIAHAKAMGAEIRAPTKTFAQLIAENGLPNRFRRFCCSELKEYKICDNVAIGVRKAESRKRNERYKEPIECRVFSKSRNERQQRFYPLLEWTDEDIKDYITENNIQCHPLYYTNGMFDVTKRLGCMCCPLMSRRKRIAEFASHPQIVKLYIRAMGKYCETHTMRRFRNPYEWFIDDVFFMGKDAEYKSFINAPLFNEGAKTYLENYFNLKF
ncbi:MAG: phosphoadenosine phosphosulfate reductase family protein [Bacteroidaceae bacterium]|nr:phosphoadenosine phosphosulfate reductase family protein [Bacteroidaceae bacterium]